MAQHTQPAFVAVPTSELVAMMREIWPTETMQSPMFDYDEPDRVAFVWRDAEARGVTFTAAHIIYRLEGAEREGEESRYGSGWVTKTLAWSLSDARGELNYASWDNRTYLPAGTSLTSARAHVVSAIASELMAWQESIGAGHDDDGRLEGSDLLMSVRHLLL